MPHLENAAPQDRKDFDRAVDYLSKDPAAREILKSMDERNVTVSIIHDGNDRYDGNNNTIYWDPRAALNVIGQDGKSAGVRSPAVLLAHEGAHATDPQFLEHLRTPNQQYDSDADAFAVGKEDEIAKSLGEPMRYNHRGYMVKTSDPTLHTRADTGQVETLAQAPEPDRPRALMDAVSQEMDAARAFVRGLQEKNADKPQEKAAPDPQVIRQFLQRERD